MKVVARRRWVHHAAFCLVALASAASAQAAGASATTLTSRTRGGPPALTRSAAVPSTSIGVSPSEDAVALVFPPATPVAEAQQWCDKALAVRNSRLGALSSELAASKTLPGSARAALSALVSADTTGIGQLQGEVAGEETLAALDALVATMIDSYRIFKVLSPQVGIALEASVQSGEVATLLALEPAIEAAITTDQQAGKSVAAAQAVYTDLSSQLTAVSSYDQIATTTVTALRAADYPSSTAVLQTARSDLADAATRLVVARADLRRIVQLLAEPGFS